MYVLYIRVASYIVYTVTYRYIYVLYIRVASYIMYTVTYRYIYGGFFVVIILLSSYDINMTKFS